MDNIKQDLKKFPRRAAQYDKVWKLLLRLYPKVNFKEIRSQEKWDEFYKSIPKEYRKQFSEKQFEDPNLWQYGPISQDEDIQKGISAYLQSPGAQEEKKEKHIATHDAGHIEYTPHETEKATVNEEGGTTLAATEIIGSQGQVSENKTISKNPSNLSEWINQLSGSPKEPASINGQPQITTQISPDLLAPHLKEAEKELQNEWQLQFDEVTQKIITKKRQELTEQLGEDQKEKVEIQVLAFMQGKKNSLGVVQLSEMQKVAAVAFEEKYGRKWIPEQRKVFQGKTTIQPAHTSLTYNEVQEKAKQLRYKTLGVDNTPTFAPKSSGFKDFSKRATTIQQAVRAGTPIPSSVTPSSPALDVSSTGFRDFSRRATAIQQEIASQNQTFYEDGSPGEEVTTTTYIATTTPSSAGSSGPEQTESSPSSASSSPRRTMPTQRPSGPRPQGRVNPSFGKGGKRGMKGMANLATKALSMAGPWGRAAAIAIKHKKELLYLFILIIGFFIMLFMMLFGEEEDLEGVLTVTLQTQDLDIPNPPPADSFCIGGNCLQALGASTTAILGQTSPDQAVLQANSNSLLDLLKNKGADFFLALQEFKANIEENKITYTINVSYTGGADDIIVRYPIPSNAMFLNATGTYTTKTTPVGGYNKISEIIWSVRQNQGGGNASGSAAASASGELKQLADPTVPSPASSSKVNLSTYWGPPYNLPNPNGASDTQYSQEAINNANTLGGAVAKIQTYLLAKLKDPKYTDPFLSVMWTMAIEGSGADPYFWNCNETTKGKAAINLGCRGWYNSGNWQVGYGIQVSQASGHLVEDFDAIYGKSDATIVQEVGNRVMQGGGITNPAKMPAKSVAQLVQEAGRPGTIFNYRQTSDTEAAAQQAIAILLMDPAIGAAAIAQEVAGDIGSDWAGNMRRWEQSYYTNGLSAQNPIFSNRIQELAKVYTGVGGSVGGGGGATFPPQSFTVTILPLEPDKLFDSGSATAEVIGARGGTGSASASTSFNPDIDCQQPPDYPTDLRQAIQDKYKLSMTGFDNDHLRWTWEMMWCFSGTKFGSLVEGTAIQVVANVGDSRMSCNGACQIWIGQMPGRQSSFAFLLSHELGHVVSYRNTREEAKWTEVENAWAKEGGISPYGRKDGGCTGTPSVFENYADLIAYFLHSKAGETTPACDPVKDPPNPLYEVQKYPLHLEAGKKILL